VNKKNILKIKQNTADYHLEMEITRERTCSTLPTVVAKRKS